MEEQERIVKGIWIPIEIWKDKNLSWNEKLLLLEIDSFTSNEKDCYISNEYISKFLGVNETNANKILSSLIKKGYVIKTKFDGRRRFVKAALSTATTLPCQPQQPFHARDINIFDDNNINNITTNSNLLKEKELKEKSDELFETCWIAYRRKGKKGKAKPYWNKLTQSEKDSVLQHIKIYTKTRELQYQQDFERYLRDKSFLSVVVSKNNIVYDPTKLGRGESASSVYTPSGNFSIMWDDQLKDYIYIGYYNTGMNIPDGYTDDNRPDGARIVLNNGRGTIQWSKETKTWIKQ